MTVTSFPEADQKILEVYADAAPAFAEIDMADKFRGVVTSSIPPEKCSQFLEICYAQREHLPQSVIDAAIAVGEYASGLGFYGLSVDQRGFSMLRVLRGEAGDIVPEPDAKYVQATVTPDPLA